MDDWIFGTLDEARRFDPLNPIRACLLGLSLLSERPSDVDIRREWFSLWSRIGGAVRKYASLAETSSAENCELATECLLRLHRYEADEASLENEDEDQRYSRWMDGFRVEIPSFQIRSLRRYSPSYLQMNMADSDELGAFVI